MAAETGFMAAPRIPTATAGEADQHYVSAVEGGPAPSAGERVRRFDRGQDALRRAALGESGKGVVVADRRVAHAAGERQQCVLRADGWIVEACRHGMRLLHLAVDVLEQERMAAMQHARHSVGERGRIVAESVAAAKDLFPRFIADDGLQRTHDGRVRVRPDGGSDAVVCAARIRHPVAQCLIDGSPQRAIAAGDGHDARAEQAHASHVGRLSLHVHGSHVDRAGHAEARAGGGGRDSMLSRAGFRDHAARAESPRQQYLADRIVDLVRARVREVLALEPHLGAPARTEPFCAGQRRGSPGPARQLAAELGEETSVRERRACARLEPHERRDQRLGHEAPAVRSIATALIREAAGDQVVEQGARARLGSRIHIAIAPWIVRAAWANCRIRS
jgi:hypothetical protein